MNNANKEHPVTTTHNIEGTLMCSESHSTKPGWTFAWVTDRNGIPYRKICDDYYGKVRDGILGWVFKEVDAGESLEGEGEGE